MRRFEIWKGDFAQIIRRFVTTKWRISLPKPRIFPEKRRSAPRKEPFPLRECRIGHRERRLDPSKSRFGFRERSFDGR